MRFSFLLVTVFMLFSCCFAADPKKVADEDESWTALKAGITQIYRGEPSLTIPQYMKLIQLVHNHCTKTTLNLRTATRGGTELIGKELYERLKNFLEEYLLELFSTRTNLSEDDLLIFYAKTWAEYRFSSRVVNDVFKYLNRHWVRREIAEGHQDVYEVFQLTLIKWREHIVQHNWHRKLSNTAIKMIERERNGEQIRSNLISGLINCLSEMDSDMTFYREHFEHAFIQDTERFYVAESNEITSKNSVTEYMEHAEKRLQEEVQRVRGYLHGSTMGILTKTCERVLIEQHIDTIRSVFQNLLDADQMEHLHRMYGLLSRIANSQDQLQEKFQKHIYKQGMLAIEQCGKDALADPKIYVQAIINVHKKYIDFVLNAFERDNGFMRALDQACIKFINSNEVTKMAKSSSKSPELFARHCHNLLKKSTKNADDGELNDLLNEVISVFKFIDDKDVFQTFYSRLLAKRLINQISISDEAESLMISKLREICGAEYTTKLQRMFQDIHISRDLTEKYRDYRSKNESDASKSFDFNAQVLSSGSWPNIGGQGVNLIMPTELKKTVDSFYNYYSKVHTNRKLTWQNNLGKGEIVTTFLKNRYILMVSTYQMAVLLQFNDENSLTVEQLVERTGIKQDYLIQVLQVFLKAKLFTCSDDESNLTDESVMNLNLGFKR